MKGSKDPSEAAFNEQGESLPGSPVATDAQKHTGQVADNGPDDDYDYGYESDNPNPVKPSVSKDVSRGAGGNMSGNKAKEEEEEEEEEDNMDVELGKLAPNSDPDKMAKMQAILSQFTEEQMNRYESFRRSGFQKSNMKKLLASITGNQKIPSPIQIVVCGIAKMFVGELVETASGASGANRLYRLRGSSQKIPLQTRDGVGTIDIDLDIQKVTVTGHLDQGKVLMAVMRAARKAEFWPSPSNNQYHPFALLYLDQQTFELTYNYDVHGYNGSTQGRLHDMPYSMDDSRFHMFSEENVSACNIM